MRLNQFLTALILFVPVVMSTQQHGDNKGDDVDGKCKKDEFWWKSKSCCLENGGPPNPPSPPEGTKCPKDTHYWHPGKGCCAPRKPDHPKKPECPKDWEWKPSEHKCKPCATPPSPPHHQPSPKPKGKGDKDGDDKDKDKGKGKGDKDHDDDDDDKDKDKDKDKGKHDKRSVRTRPVRCPIGLWACPIAGLTGGYECLDIRTELESCGGCTTLGQGQDCTKIEGAWNVGCERGSCKIYSCDAGYILADDGASCISL